MSEIELCIWTKIVQQEIDKLMKLQNETDLIENPFRYGLIRGNIDGFSQALTWLSIVEEGKRFKDRISEIRKEVEKEGIDVLD